MNVTRLNPANIRPNNISFRAENDKKEFAPKETSAEKKSLNYKIPLFILGLAAAGAGIYYLAKGNSSKAIKTIADFKAKGSFVKGEAILKNGKKFTGTLEHVTKSGVKKVFEYKDGKLLTSKIGDEITKTYTYNNGIFNKVVKTDKKGDILASVEKTVKDGRTFTHNINTAHNTEFYIVQKKVDGKRGIDYTVDSKHQLIHKTGKDGKKFITTFDYSSGLGNVSVKDSKALTEIKTTAEGKPFYIDSIGWDGKNAKYNFRPDIKAESSKINIMTNEGGIKIKPDHTGSLLKNTEGTYKPSADLVWDSKNSTAVFKNTSDVQNKEAAELLKQCNEFEQASRERINSYMTQYTDILKDTQSLGIREKLPEWISNFTGKFI